MAIFEFFSIVRVLAKLLNNTRGTKVKEICSKSSRNKLAKEFFKWLTKDMEKGVPPKRMDDK